MVYFFESFNDTVYTIKNDKRLFFDKGYENIVDFFQSLAQTDYAFGAYQQYAENERTKMVRIINGTKLTFFDAQKKTSQTFSTIQDDIFFNSLKIPVNNFSYFAGESIVFPVDAATIVDWRENHQVS
ncbi:MAG: hypothetical protein LBT50_05350 [Prevotellaceae bacterium]|nr:hypothetical protein [Prevotellaceae bacterium]